MSNAIRLLVRLVFGLAVAGALVWIGWKLGGKAWALVALLVSAPTVAWLITRPLIEVMHEGFTWVGNQPLEKWQGNYYQFGSVQVRIFDDGQLWFAAKDIIEVTGVKANADSLLAVYPGGCKVLDGLTCLNAPSVEKLLASRSGTESGRFLLWMRREVIAPWERKRTGALAAR